MSVLVLMLLNAAIAAVNEPGAIAGADEDFLQSVLGSAEPSSDFSVRVPPPEARCLKHVLKDPTAKGGAKAVICAMKPAEIHTAKVEDPQAGAAEVQAEIASDRQFAETMERERHEAEQARIRAEGEAAMEAHNRALRGEAPAVDAPAPGEAEPLAADPVPTPVAAAPTPAPAPVATSTPARPHRDPPDRGGGGGGARDPIERTMTLKGDMR